MTYEIIRITSTGKRVVVRTCETYEEMVAAVQPGQSVRAGVEK